MPIGRATIKMLPTGVVGLDEALGGGLPELSFNLLAGPPGSGKTTLAHQIMFALATPERPALYFTVLDDAWKIRAGDDAPGHVKAMAGSAIVLWLAVIYCGSMLPFIGGAF